MAFSEVELTKDEWTLIGNNVTDMTFQNNSQQAVYINFNSSTTVPTEEVGLIYAPWQGELKKDVTELTYKVSPNYVFARSITRRSSLIIETS